MRRLPLEYKFATGASARDTFRMSCLDLRCFGQFQSLTPESSEALTYRSRGIRAYLAAIAHKTTRRASHFSFKLSRIAEKEFSYPRKFFHLFGRVFYEQSFIDACEYKLSHKATYLD